LGVDGPPVLRGTALNALAQLHWFRGDYAAGTRLATEARLRLTIFPRTREG